MRVTVSWASGWAQFERPVDLPAGASIALAIAYLREQLPATQLTPQQLPDWDHAAVGVFGERCERSAALREGDRVEIYRPLLIDPKEGRRARAQRVRR